MQIKIKRFDKTLPLPAYIPDTAAGFDLFVRLDVEIPSGQVVLVPLNVAIEIPEGYHALLMSRSSTFKRGLSPANGLGLIDHDYRGDNDEWFFPLFNYTKSTIILEKGDRVAQVLIEKTETIEISEVNHLSSPDRGGFGSTGNK
ncbi:MAG TPA: dUTP diphosphatase [Candidatus Woesebacteria bacterium]|nr:dUTP diphosphatase [Candidatus Woesebacteria bacterium]HPR99741.1 dUTP diphosphatase [Candidatus Woesebacteria bacterium]